MFVSQGFAGMLGSESKKYSIDGLYTEDFTACNVLIVYDEDSIYLVHCDAQLYQQDTNKIAVLLEEGNKVILIHNEQGADLARVLTNLIGKYPGVTLDINVVDAKIKGISVKFDPDDSKNSPITGHKKTPPNLIYHPQERQLTTIQQLEQIISLRDQSSKGASRRKQKEFMQFWETHWIPFGPTETNFDLSRPLTKMDVAMFSPLDTWIAIKNTMKKLMKIIKKECGVEFGPRGYRGMMMREQIVEIAAFHMEDYLHSYPEDSSFFLRRNIMAVLKSWLPPTFWDDAEFTAKVDEILTANSDIFSNMKTLLDSYPELNIITFGIIDDPDFDDDYTISSNVIDLILTLERDNDRRNKWAAAAKIRQQYQELANQKKLEAIALCDENKLAEAVSSIGDYYSYLI